MEGPPDARPGREPDRHEFTAWPELLRSEPSRRGFLKQLGGGLLVFCLAARTDRACQAPAPGADQTPPSRSFEPGQIAAWLHIASDGRVTAYTGKVEVGQNARTSLTQVVAEELEVEPEQVEIVMGDTGRTPHDIGTFGSLTTPQMVPRLRKAAACARLLLLDLAARHWEREDRSGLETRSGTVIDRASQRTVSYAELARDQELSALVDDAVPLRPASEWRVAGQSVPKVQARSFVTGSHSYPIDQKIAGMRHGKILRPPAFGATLEAIDLSAAEQMAGVSVVREGSFVGVVANDELTAGRARAALKPRWRRNDTVCTQESLPGYLRDHQRGDSGGPAPRERGSMQAGRSQADVWLERTYDAAFIAHAPLEPRSAIARWDDGDRLTVWTGTQVPFGVRNALAHRFGIDESRVRVIALDMGSGYGGKHTPEVDIEAAALARAVKAPVRVAWSREEEFTWAYFRPAALVEIQAGARSDGRITAWDCKNFNAGTAGLDPPYALANSRLAFQPCDSPLRQGSYRALASTVNHFARESMIDELGTTLGLGRLAMRLKNLENPRVRAVLEAAATRFGWTDDPPQQDRQPRIGQGLACAADKGSVLATFVEVEVNPDDDTDPIRVRRIVASFEAGAILNPDHLLNQVQGALTMGLGGALFETVRFENGTLTNPRFSRYRVPRFHDIPQIEVVLLDPKDQASAGAGEIPIVCIAPAIANAVAHACGKRVRSMPLQPALGLA